VGVLALLQQCTCFIIFLHKKTAIKKILIKGGSGFVGRRFIAATEKVSYIGVTSFSRSEGTISRQMMECTDKRLKIEMGDVRYTQVVCRALRGMDTVIHLAAMTVRMI